MLFCGMDQALIVKHLAQAVEHIALGERLIARQKEIVATLQAGGHDTATAQWLLVQFEDLQTEHVSHRDWLNAKLAEISRPDV